MHKINDIDLEDAISKVRAERSKTPYGEHRRELDDVLTELIKLRSVDGPDNDLDDERQVTTIDARDV